VSLIKIKKFKIEGGRGSVSASKQGDKFIHAEIGLPDDGTEGASIQFVMFRDNNLCEGFVSAEDEVASLLTLEVETGLRQRLDAFPTRDSG